MNDENMKAMLVEYMGRGFLDNIAALFRQEPSLCRMIPDLLGSESLHVRLGTVALVEELITSHREAVRTAVPGLVGLLKHENPTIRGDAASVLGTIGDFSAVAGLETSMTDDHAGVREAVQDALSEIAGKQQGEY
jgi:HEAT repeat protein